MSKANEPAFPQQEGKLIQKGDGYEVREGNGVRGGLTRLEYFAGLAMQGLLSDPHWDADTIEEGAEMCVKWSAALIAELEKHHE